MVYNNERRGFNPLKHYLQIKNQLKVVKATTSMDQPNELREHLATKQAKYEISAALFGGAGCMLLLQGVIFLTKFVNNITHVLPPGLADWLK